ncbi:MAG: diguanylate cyclase (GGDEF)-like protein/PAS domain S-box-containing protein [Polyangiales bacterium]|jgi:diguanylate cyclase (GGDEF)-like protein/PAS domain S-box-containing protein
MSRGSSNFPPSTRAKVRFDLPPLCSQLLDAMPDAVIATDLNGVIVMASARVHELLGYTPEALVGHPIEHLVPAVLREKHVTLRRGYVRNPRSRSMADLGIVEASRADGTSVPVVVALAPLKSRHGHYVICSVRDATLLRAREEELERLTTTDSMTDLYNRGYFDAELRRVSVARHLSVGLLVADIDGLKLVNDRLGHDAGDALIRRAAAVLRGVFRGEDIVARTGGDEFAVLLRDVSQEDLSAALARIQKALRLHNELTHGGGRLSLSVGGAWTSDSSRVRDALKEADAAMYRNKRASTAPRGRDDSRL